jgi:hypothetical protein
LSISKLLAYVTAQLTECSFIAVGILSLLALGTLRIDAGGAGPATLQAVGKALVAVHDWTFLLGPGFVVGVGNGLILGYRCSPRALFRAASPCSDWSAAR